MCRDYYGYHSGGSSFVYVNDSWLLQKNYLYTHRYKLNSKKKKKSQYMVSHPETGSDSPIGSDRDRGRDMNLTKRYCCTPLTCTSFQVIFVLGGLDLSSSR